MIPTDRTILLKIKDVSHASVGYGDSDDYALAHKTDLKRDFQHNDDQVIIWGKKEERCTCRVYSFGNHTPGSQNVHERCRLHP